MMVITDFFSQTAWRLRAYLPQSTTDDTEEAFFHDLRVAEHQAALHQLPIFAASRYSQCAYTDPSGSRCQMQAGTPPLYGFLCHRPNAPVYQDSCQVFVGGLCTCHLAHLIVPPASWWPEKIPLPTGQRDERGSLYDLAFQGD